MSMSTESLPFEGEAASTGTEGGNGSVETTPEVTSDSQVASSSEQDPEAGSYDDRLRDGGDFAVEQTKNWQRKFNAQKTEREKVEGQLQSVDQLLPIVDQLGGAAAVIQHLEQLGKMIGDAKLGPIIQQFQQTGTVALGEEDGEGEYVDPEIAELRSQLRTLTGDMQNLRGDTFKQTSALAQQKLQGHFEKAIGEFPFNEAELAKINTKAEQTINQWSTTAEGVRALEGLNDQSVSALIRSALDSEDWISVVRRMDTTRQEGKQRMATDAPASTATGEAKSLASNAIEACREAFKKEGLDPNRGLTP